MPWQPLIVIVKPPILIVKVDDSNNFFAKFAAFPAKIVRPNKSDGQFRRREQKSGKNQPWASKGYFPRLAGCHDATSITLPPFLSSPELRIGP